MGLKFEKRNELAAMAFMEVVGKMEAKHLNLQRFIDRVNGWMKKANGSWLERTKPNDFDVVKFVSMVVSVNIGEKREYDGDFNGHCFFALVLYYWTEDFQLGYNLKRRINSNLPEGASKEDICDLVEIVVVELIDLLRSK